MYAIFWVVTVGTWIFIELIPFTAYLVVAFSLIMLFMVQV